MNRSILIVICDFLLVSLLVFSSVDVNNIADNGVTKPMNVGAVAATNQGANGDNDLANAMKVALEEERKSHDQLESELAHARQDVNQRDQQVQTFQLQLQARDQDAQHLQAQQASLQQQYASAQNNLQNLNQKLQTTSSEAALSEQQLEAMKLEASRQAEQASALQSQLSQLARSNQAVLAEKQQLSTQLQLAEVEKRAATEQAAQMQDEVKAEREEKAKLADDVKVLATKSGELATEIRQSQPLAPNEIFNDVLTNHVEARFVAQHSNALGFDANKRKETDTVLVTDGTNTFALCHVQETPFSFWAPASEQWQELAGWLVHDSAEVSIKSLSFFWPDPRVVLIPVSADDARQLGCKVYSISKDPYKFQDAVLIGAKNSYYGECRFQIDQTTPAYIKLDRSMLKGLFGQFNPSRGDLVFSQTGELLGVMANSSYCMMIRGFDSTATLQFGPDVRAQHTGDTLSRLYSFVSGMPNKLQ
jgi:hypothetical protein